MNCELPNSPKVTGGVPCKWEGSQRAIPLPWLPPTPRTCRPAPSGRSLAAIAWASIFPPVSGSPPAAGSTRTDTSASKAALLSSPAVLWAFLLSARASRWLVRCLWIRRAARKLMSGWNSGT